jgi:O-acetyl-ADP-ribose deacetylase (regulator of RNase III)
MPFHIIRQDITKIECDAIVNAANSSLLGGGGVDGCIHRAAGPDLVRECATLHGCEVGEAKFTKGYLLPSKYVIHTVGPVWNGGGDGEEELLRSCYRNSFAVAEKLGCETLAMPLISSGAFGYPKAEALRIAVECVREFLCKSDMTVYLTVFDRAAFEVSKNAADKVLEYIDDHYVNEYAMERRAARWASEPSVFPALDKKIVSASYSIKNPVKKTVSRRVSESEISNLLRHIDDPFSVTLLKLIDKKGMTDVECYKKANVSKQTWYKIINDASYRPSKTTVFSFAIALSLTLDETNALLETVGFAISHSSRFDLVIEYFINEGIYDIFIINEMLFKFDLPCLGV